MKYILVTGGVISGVGKGIISSSLGVLLRAHGLRVSAIKIDPYINIDAGTFSPLEHGEVFVLDDGGEVDLDLGNYERFLDARLTRDNNITTGKIYQHVINKERRGDYLGKTVQVVPHVTDEIQQWVRRVAALAVDRSGKPPHLCIIEAESCADLGGTIGDIEGMPFVEAFRQMQFREGGHDFLNVHVSWLPEPGSTGEQKTKPTQNSVRLLRAAGLSPDLVVCRSHTLLNASVKDKISNFCQVDANQVICVNDVTNLYHVPLLLYEQNVLTFVNDRLDFQLTPNEEPPTDGLTMAAWTNFADRVDCLFKEVTIALVGKYVELKDAYASVSKALHHAAIAAERKLVIHFIDSEHLQQEMRQNDAATYDKTWTKLKSAQGILVPGGFGDRGIEGKIAACGWARRNRIPFLGICLGMQCAIIEFARDRLGVPGANSTEFDAELTAEQQFIVDMPEHSGQTNARGMGATMRLGKRTTVFLTPHSTLRRLYGGEAAVDERHRHRYEVNPAHVAALCAAGLRFVGMGVDEGTSADVLAGDDGGLQRSESSMALLRLVLDNQTDADLLGAVRSLCDRSQTDADAKPVRMEIVELKDHPYFVGVQFHPEYLSHPLRPSAPYLGLVLAASGQLDSYTRSPSTAAAVNHCSTTTTTSTRLVSPSVAVGGNLSNGFTLAHSETSSSDEEVSHVGVL